MPKGDKYLELRKYLAKSNQPVIKLSFTDIEKIIHGELPPTAYNNSTWWANDTKGHVQSISWLDAGYKTSSVSDTYKDAYIVFIKTN